MSDSKRTVGKVSWGSPSSSSDRTETKRLPFLEMKEHNKSWKIRVVSDDPMRYWCHWTVNKEGRKVKVNCTLNRDCPVVDEKTKAPCGGQAAQARYYIKVIDREDGKLKVLDAGIQIVKAIGELHRNEDWGHSKQYDITIKKGPKGANPLYSIAPSPKSALSTADLALVQASEDPTHADYIDLESRVKPLSADTIKKILMGNEGGDSFSDSSKRASATQKASAKATQPESDDDIIEWDESDE